MGEPNKACPACQEQGHDSTGDHLFLMDDQKTWCCIKADYHKDGKNYLESGGVRKTSKEKDEVYEGFTKLSEVLALKGKGPSDEYESGDSDSGFDDVSTTATLPIQSLPSNGDVKERYRGISPATFKLYGVSGSYDSKGNLESLVHDLIDADTGSVITQKCRKLPKDFFCTGKTGKGTKLQLFGQSTFSHGKKLMIVEGELDAMSAYEMFQQSKYTKNIAVVSLPLGANVKALLDNTKYLKNFKEIYVCADNDKAGEKVSRDIASALPSAKFLTISEKDANDMLVAGKESEFQNALFSAEPYKPDFIVKVSDVMDKVMLRPSMGEPWPWPTLTKLTYGRNGGHGMYLGAGVKQGKSEFVNQLIAFDIARGKKIACLKYEEPPAMTVKRVAGKLDGIFYHRPGVIYNDADLKKRGDDMEDYLFMYPAFGKANWESTREFVRYAAMSGCETIIIDPVTKLSNGLTSSETEDMLRTMTDELSCMAMDLNFYYLVTCHLRAPTNGPPHERGGKVQTYQFRGSRSMSEATHHLLGIERNKDPDLPDDVRNTSKFVLLEDRNFGQTGSFPVFYDVNDQSYLEPTSMF